MQHAHTDVRIFGARTMSSAALVRLLFPKASDDAVQEVVEALDLQPVPREAALVRSPLGPRLLAALELGRRARAAPTSTRARIIGPAYAIAAAYPHMELEGCLLLAVDARSRLAACRPIVGSSADPDTLSVATLQAVLMAGCARGILVQRRAGLARYTEADLQVWSALHERGAFVGVRMLDHIIWGDDGWQARSRADDVGKAAPAHERRYGDPRA